MRQILIITTCVSLHSGLLSAQAASSLSSQVSAFVSVDAPVVALLHVRVIDGTGRPVANDQTIVISNGRIETVGKTGDVDVPSGAEVMELSGHTVVPGFVGMHNHTFYTTSGRTAQLNFSAPRLYLASGVTTVRTTGSFSPYSEINLKRAIKQGEVPGPRMHITGPYITGTGASWTGMYQLSGPDDARRVVAYWAEEGATWIKAYTLISREELGAAIDEAHKRGLKVTGHLCSVTFSEAVALGIDNLEHGLLTNTDYDPEKTPDVCPQGSQARVATVDISGEAVQATFRDMVENDVAMTSTLAVFELYVPNRPPLEQRVLDAMAPEIRDEYLETRERYSAIPESSQMVEFFRSAMDFERAFVKAGGLLAAGVDPTGYGGALPGFGDQRNFELLREAGFSPEETIQILSANGARVLGVFDELGSIEPGKLADLVVIDGDPTTNAADIKNVTVVFKDGVGYDSAKLIESVRGIVGRR